MSFNVIQLYDLKKYFKEVKAVDGVNFSIDQGEIFGLLGPNGAGKTTILNILCTLLKPTSGTATVCNHDINKRQRCSAKEHRHRFSRPQP